MTRKPLTLWVSPFDPYPTVDALAAAASAVSLTGYVVRVALPVLYGTDFQKVCRRDLGDELAPADAEEARAIRVRLEALGVPCDGWCVPRLGDDPAAEGRQHGLAAAYFDNWLVNTEAGWDGFLQRTDAAAIDAYWTGFWNATDSHKLNGHVGITWVNNSMLDAIDDDGKRALLGGSNFDCLESYGANGPGRDLDPAVDVPAWRAQLRRLGKYGRRRIVPIVVPDPGWQDEIKRWGRTLKGGQVWSLGAV